MLYVVIMVGGAGTRLWPRSRKARPKQLMQVGSAESLIRGCVNRALAVTAPANVLVITTAEHEGLCRREMPEVPAENIYAEPRGRDTAACVGFGAVLVQSRDADGIMVVLPADHLIKPVDAFARSIQAAAAIAGERRCVVTTGIVPRSAATCYGYIQRGEKIRDQGGIAVYHQIRFREKPDAETARRFLAGGDHYWNSGIFVWRADVILEAFRKHAPGHAAPLAQIAQALGTGGERAAIAAAYERFAKISVDYAIMEHVSDVVTVEGSFDWDDVGSWTAVGDHLPTDAEGNAVEGDFVGIDCAGCVVVGHPDRLIAAVGLQDMVVVDDGDVVFLCPKARDQEVRRMVEELRRRRREELL